MSTEFRPTEGIFLLNGINVTKILHDISSENKIKIPPLEDIVLKKSKSINEKILKNAQERQDAWRANIQRFKNHREKLSQVRSRMRTDRELSNENLRKKQIALLQRKSTLETKLNEKRLYRAKSFEIKEPTPEEKRQESNKNKKNIIEQAREKTAESKKGIEKSKELLQKERKEVLKASSKKLKEKTEFTKDVVVHTQDKVAQTKKLIEKNQKKIHTEKKEQTEFLLENLKEKGSIVGSIVKRAQEKVAQKKELFKEHQRKLHAGKKEQTKILLESLKEKNAIIDYIVKRAKEKILELKNSFEERDIKQAQKASNALVVETPSDRRKETRQIIEDIVQKRHIQFEENLQPVLKHFENLKQRMVEIFDSLGRKREKAIIVLYEIILKAQRKAAEALFASGNPRAQAKRLPELDYFSIIKERMSQIYDTLKKVDIRENETKIETEPSEAEHKMLSDIEIHLAKKRNEILSIISKPDIDTRYLKTLSELPNKERKKINKIFYKIITYFLDPKHNIKAERQHTLSISQRIKRRPYHLLLSHVVEEIITFRNFYLLLKVLGDNHPYDIFPLAEKNLEEISLILQQENFKSILSGMLIDKTFKADEILKENKVQNINIKNIEESTSYFANIIHKLTHNKYNVHQPGDEIYTIVNFSPEFFNSLGEEIDKGIRREMFTTEELFRRPDEKELEQEKIKKSKEQIRKNTRKKKLIADQERKKEFLELIRKQNMTAHQKAMNERRLIDLFF